MGTQKLSFDNIKNELSRDEMKNILVGSGRSGGGGGGGSNDTNVVYCYYQDGTFADYCTCNASAGTPPYWICQEAQDIPVSNASYGLTTWCSPC